MGNRRVRMTAGAGQVEVRGSGPGQTVDVWLGTVFGSDEPPRYDVEQTPATPERSIAVEASWNSGASFDGTPAAGTIVRLRLPPGRSAATFVPVG